MAACEAALGPVFAGRPRDVTEENIQARIRGVHDDGAFEQVWRAAAHDGKQERNGRRILHALRRHVRRPRRDLRCVQDAGLRARALDQSRARRIIPLTSIEKPPIGRIAPGQIDQDSLPPYDVLDAILKGYVEEGLSRRDLVAQGFNETVVNDIVRKVDLNEYKRKQAAPGLKITPLAFGVGRRIPIVQKYVS